MKNWLLHIILNALALFIVAALFQAVHIDGVAGALLAAFILSILNAIVRPILVVLTLPITILTLGLFLFVVNAITLLLTDAILGNMFEIDGFFTAILAAIVISLLNLILNSFVKK
ncbi:putative membrane protein YvlD [Thalassobacillus devorans]|uniref:Membrane protein YvlD n=1 Tax=Thalassobacillus devorans TaxID=279813 RepID=A0ABQ1NT31_9BACI|nr:phage holin family protein [Thalassobacillus devorans]NIK28909.1 putative membrane protein [Thalassobacillus devorans]GGC82660.1 putative membrane protein YvlD [Thalassobacillus devorans]